MQVAVSVDSLSGCYYPRTCALSLRIEKKGSRFAKEEAAFEPPGCLVEDEAFSYSQLIAPPMPISNFTGEL